MTNTKKLMGFFENFGTLYMENEILYYDGPILFTTRREEDNTLFFCLSVEITEPNTEYYCASITNDILNNILAKKEILKNIFENAPEKYLLTYYYENTKKVISKIEKISEFDPSQLPKEGHYL